MSYSRWGRDSDWYIYRQSGAQRLEDELLSVWHATGGPGEPNTEFSCADVSEMLARNDFSLIRGWSPAADSLLREALNAFVKDVLDIWRGGPSAPSQ